VLDRFTEMIPNSSREDGQTMAEYAVVLGSISIAAVLVIGSISVIVTGQFEGVAAILRGLLP
jgi:Flp pilus assembly pilin Flp